MGVGREEVEDLGPTYYIFSKKGHFPSFVREKLNLTVFDAWKHFVGYLWKIHIGPPLEKFLRRP